MPRAISPRTSSPPASPTAAPSSSPTPSASPQPLSIYVDLHGTGKVDEAKLEEALREVMDLSPRGIREHLDLNSPIYARTSAYGHFGRQPDNDGGFSWEKTDLVEPIRAELT